MSLWLKATFKILSYYTADGIKCHVAAEKRLPVLHHCADYTLMSFEIGVVGCGEGVVYLTSSGRPTDIGLQLGRACYPCSR